MNITNKTSYLQKKVLYDITPQDKYTQVIVEEQPKNIEMESSRPTTRATKLKQWWIKQMKDSVLVTIILELFLTT